METIAEDWIVAGAFAHPAFLDEGHFERIKRTLLQSFTMTATPDR